MVFQQRIDRFFAGISLAALLAGAGPDVLAGSTNPPALVLTPEEQAWVADHPIVRLSADPAWPPMSEVVNNQLTGIDADFLVLISERTGLKFQFVPTRSWADTWKAAADRQVDVISGVARTPERAEVLNFTRPYLSFPVAIITRKDGPFLASLENLDNFRVAAPRDYVTTLRLQKMHPDTDFVFTDNTEDALIAVADGRADVLADNIAVAAYHIHRKGLENLKISGVADYEFSLCFGVRKDWPVLADILQKAVASVTSLEREAICSQWILPDVQGTVKLHFWRRVVIYGGSAVLLLLIVILFYNRRMAAEIQRRHQVEARFKTTQDRLLQLNDQKTWFLNVVAHDLKNPIFGVLMAADMLEKLGTAPEGTQKKLLDTISESGWRMDRLVKNLLNFNAIEQGTLSFASKPVDAVAKTREVVSRHHHAADMKEIRLVFEAPPAAMFMGDPDAFVEVAENTLSNAIKFSAKGGSINITVTAADGLVRLSIHDSGPGIDAAKLPTLFKRPADVRLKPTTSGGSTGLGLSISRYFVEAMDGKIRCESEPGKGSTFIIEFPEAKV